MLKVIDSWWTLHPHLVEIIFFSAALLVTLFPKPAQRLARAPLYYAATRAFRFMQRGAESQLKIMHLVNGDAYKLVAYISFYCINAVLVSLGETLVFAIILAFLSIWHKGQIDFRLLPMVFMGGMVGRAIKLYFLNGLLTPETTIERLEKMAAGGRV